MKPLSPGTQVTYRKVMIRAFGGAFASPDMVPDRIPADVKRWTDSNLALLRAAVKRRYTEARKSEMETQFILDQIPVQWVPQRRTEIPAEEEAMRYEAECAKLSPGRHAMALLPLATGLRAAEALSLPRRSVERAAVYGELLVFRKGGKEQVIDASHAKPLFEELMSVRALKLMNPFESALAEGKAWKVTGEILSTGTPASAYHALHEMVKAVGEKAGIEGLRPHKLRHAFATRMLRDGAPVPVISWTLGHASIQTTMKYLHPGKADAARFMRKF